MTSKAVTKSLFTSGGNSLDLLQGARLGDLGQQLLAVESPGPGHLLEDGVDLEERVPDRTLRTKLTAKSGSIPLEQPAMMLIVPVGAMVLTVALRISQILGRHRWTWENWERPLAPRPGRRRP